MSKPLLVPILVTRRKIQEDECAFIEDSEIKVTFSCDACGKVLNKLLDGRLVIDIDLSSYPREFLGRDDLQNFVYSLSGGVRLIHASCDDERLGVRVSGREWAERSGGVGITPRFSLNRGNVKPKEGTRPN